ncbi:MAG: hypothetical protein LBD91_01220 [Prevotellaceae bacterium]|jgi:hypothetical protein|nr:hypothetical protein [Prevotellaceae bacterium]
MQKLTIIIERSANFYDAYAENCYGLYGAGKTLDEVKENIMKVLRRRLKDPYFLPAILKGRFEVEFVCELPAFINHYAQKIGYVGLERITGIERTNLIEYSKGSIKPRQPTLRKMEKALHDFAAELKQTSLFN